MSVVGFDVGNLNCFVAVARAGGIETIANEYSERCTPAVVAFNDVQRLVGISAKNQMVMNYKNSILNFKRLIGHKYDEPYTQEEIKRFNQKVSRLDDGDIGIHVRSRGEEKVYTPEQIMAMLLSELKNTAQANLQTKITDCVISVPSYFTDHQRRAMMQSSKIAGLNCLKLMNDTSAVALNYGLFKQDLPAAEEKPRNVAFVDLGHSALQVSIAAFNKGKIQVLSTTSDDSVGGRMFDERLQEFFSEEFLKKYKLDVPSNPKAWLRLGNDVEKIKKQMSANTQPLPLRIECFMNDIDVAHHVDRAIFEDICMDLLERLQAPMSSALKDSGLKPEEINSVEIIGGATRMPALKNTIEAIFGKAPSATLNQDEAVSRGCAIQCAMLSHTVRVRDIEVLDAANYPINISWDSTKGQPGEMEVFKKNHSYPFTKLLTFPHRVEPFCFKAFYRNDVSIPHVDRLIGEFIVNAAAPTEAPCDKTKVKVKVRLDQNGCFTVHSATMVESLEQPPPEKENDEPMDTTENSASSTSDTPTEPLTNGDRKDEKLEGKKKENSEGSDQPMDAEGDEKQTEQTNGEKEKDKSEKESDKKSKSKKKEEPKKTESKKPKKLTKSTELKVDTKQAGPTAEQLNNLINIEGEILFQVRMERERSDAKNSVEEYVYAMKSKLFGEYESYVTEEDRSKFDENLTQIEDWLYDEGENETKQVYVDKLVELKKIGDPIGERCVAHQKLPEAIESFGKSITHYRKILDLYEAKDEKYSHIDAEEMKKVKNKLDDRFNWFNQKMNENAKCPKTSNPAVYPSQIETEKKLLQTFCDPIINKPKPKAEPPKDTPPADAAKTDNKTQEEKPENSQPTENGDNTAETMETDAPSKTEPTTEIPATDLNMEVD